MLYSAHQTFVQFVFFIMRSTMHATCLRPSQPVQPGEGLPISTPYYQYVHTYVHHQLMVWHCQSRRSGSHDLENTGLCQPINTKSNTKSVDQHPELVLHWDLVSSVAICVAKLLLKGHGDFPSLVYNTWERTHTPHGHKSVYRKNTHKLVYVRIGGVTLTS